MECVLFPFSLLKAFGRKQLDIGDVIKGAIVGVNEKAG